MRSSLSAIKDFSGSLNDLPLNYLTTCMTLSDQAQLLDLLELQPQWAAQLPLYVIISVNFYPPGEEVLQACLQDPVMAAAAELYKKILGQVDQTIHAVLQKRDEIQGMIDETRRQHLELRKTIEAHYP
jgi:hypothetical protein